MFSKTSVILAAALAIAAPAQAYNTTFVTGLGQFLTSHGFTSLADAVTSSINSTGTQNLLNNINATGRTLLAPTDTAFTGFQSRYPNSSNPEFLGDVLNYHLLAGSFPGSAFATDPNHTVARTFLNDSAVVQLEGGLPQAIVFSIQGGATRVLNQNTNVTIINTTSYQNLLIQVVDAVVDLPGNLSSALSAWNLTGADTLLSGLNYTTPLTQTRGFTLFVPNDAAFGAANATLNQLAASNITQVYQVINNHVINGTTAYSTTLAQAKLTSAGGEGFSFVTNSSGTFVTSGNSTAKVVVADILLDNGVIHIIDHILLNNATNAAAASSAYSAATSSAAAAATSVQSGAVGSSSGGSSKKSSALATYTFTTSNVIQAGAVLGSIFAGAAILI